MRFASTAHFDRNDVSRKKQGRHLTLHLIKLCVGAESIQDLQDWQSERLKQMRTQKLKPELVHVTRMLPSRADEILDGGSLYWVMKGNIRCRQKITGIESFIDKEGVKRCRLVLDKQIVPVQRREKRPFQGWRYLDAKDAPKDASVSETDEDMPEEMRAELEALGLL